MTDQKKSILLVEDEALISVVQVRALQAMGFGVRSVDSGEKAVDLFKRGELIDLVLMDIDLGKGMDGTEAARRILELADLPILFLSSHSEREIVEKTESISSYGYISKSSGSTVLEASIKMAFRLHEARRLIDRQNIEISVNNEQLRLTVEELQVSNEELDTTNEQLIETGRELHNSERQYRMLFENLTAGFALHKMVYDDTGKPVDYRFIDVNPAFERLTGLRGVDLIGKTVLEVMPNTEAYWIETYGRVAATGEPNAYVNYSQALGKHFDVWVFSPQHEYFATVFSDISGRVNAENDLNEALTHFETLFETIVQGIVYHDATGKIISANPAAERMLGLTRDQLMGRESIDPRWNTTQEDGTPFLGSDHPAMVALRTGKEVRNVVMSVNNPLRKETVWMQVSAIPLFRDGESLPFQVYATMEDISERKRVIDALTASEKRYSLTLEAVKDGIWDWNVPSGEAYFSPSYYSVLDYADGEFTANYASWREKVHPEDIEGAERQLGEGIARGDGFSIDLRMSTASGAWRWVRTRGKAIELDAAGKALRMVGTLSDIDASKRMEMVQAFLSTGGWEREGSDFFRSLAEVLADCLSVEYVCIDSLEQGNCYATTLAVYHDGSFEDNVRYALKDTPCGAVVDKRLCVFPRGVRELFPADKVLQDLRAESYVGTTLFDVKGNPIGLIAIIGRFPLRDEKTVVDILKVVSARAGGELERKLGERELNKLVEQKGMLMKELQHRVKNNMSVVAGLLNLQMNAVPDEASRNIFMVAQNRIRSMSLIYEKLMVLDDPSRIDLGVYVKELSEAVFEAYKVNKENVCLRIKLASVSVDTNRAALVGLIVNELVTNVLKYAFPSGRKGSLSLSLERNGERLRLVVSDDGIGYSPESSPQKAGGLGLSLIQMLASQLHAELGIKGSSGTSVSLEFSELA